MLCLVQKVPSALTPHYCRKPLATIPHLQPSHQLASLEGWPLLNYLRRQSLASFVQLEFGALILCISHRARLGVGVWLFLNPPALLTLRLSDCPFFCGQIELSHQIALSNLTTTPSTREPSSDTTPYLCTSLSCLSLHRGSFPHCPPTSLTQTPPRPATQDSTTLSAAAARLRNRH